MMLGLLVWVWMLRMFFSVMVVVLICVLMVVTWFCMRFMLMVVVLVFCDSV